MPMWRRRPGPPRGGDARPIDGGGYLRTLLAAVLHKDIVSRSCLRRQLRGECRLFYWKDPHCADVDFVIHKGQKEKRGESRETWQGRSALIRREPVWRWLLDQG